MISRIALLIASLATAATLMVALAAAGFAPGSSPPVPAAITTSPASPIVAADPTPPPVQVDTIYLAPVPEQKTITVRRVVASTGGEGAESGEGAEGND